MSAALFVYGTLMPGRLRWPMLADHARDWEPAAARGVLYDTGHGWPAADLSPADPDDRVPGWLVHLRAAGLDGLLATLDAMEGIADPPAPATDPYVRVLVEVAGEHSGAVRAWAYHATVVDPRWGRIERWTGIDER